MKEARFCSNMIKELELRTRSDSVRLNLDNPSALHVAENRTDTPRIRQMTLRYFCVQELVRECRIGIHYVENKNQLADIGTKCLS